MLVVLRGRATGHGPWRALCRRRAVFFICPQTGSRAHEAFIYNAAKGRLDVYAFDLWNLNQCQCAYPQKGLDMCSNGG